MKNKSVMARITRIALICLIICSMLGAVPPTASAQAFSIGDTVEVTANLNVRTGAGTSFPEISDPDYPGYAPAGTIGEIIGGPSNADGYIWWRVDYGCGLYTGWSIEDGLADVTQPPSPPNLISPSNGATGISLTPTFQWSSVCGADYYGLYISEPPYGPSNLVFDSELYYGSLYGTSLTLPSGILSNGVTYYWNMRAHNSAGWGSFSTSRNFTTAPPSLPDLTVGPIWMTPYPPSPGGDVNISVRIENQGEGDAVGTFFLELYIDSTYIGHVSIYGLASGATRTSTWQLIEWPADCNQHIVRGVVDPDNVITESIETNNSLSVPFAAAAPTPCTPSNPSPSNHQTNVPITSDLNWSDCCNTDYYELYFGTSSTPPFYGTTSASNYSLPSLTCNITYYWRVIAKNNCGGSTTGSTWDFTTTQCLNPTICHDPSSVGFSTNHGSDPSNQILNIWNCGGAGTTLNWSVTDNAPWLNLGPSSGSSTGETDSITVSVNSASMNPGIYSATITISALGATNHPRTVPVTLEIYPRLTMQVNGCGSTSPIVGTYYYAYGTVVTISADPCSDWTFIGWTGDVANPNEPTTTVTTDSNKTVTANIIPGAETPQAPSSLTAIATSSSQINLSWSDNSNNEDGFRIERKTGAGGTYSQIASVGPNVTSYQNTGLSASTTYYYRVRAYNVAGNSAYSNEAGDTTQSLPDTTPPVITTVQTTTVTATSATITWNTDEPATSIVNYGIGTPPSDTSANPALVTSHSVTIGNLVADTTYYYEVQSTDASDNTAIDNNSGAYYSFTTEPATTGVQGIDVSHWQGDINWNQVYSAGYIFAFAKATEGDGLTDDKFITNMNNGHASGMLMGPYHFARPDLGNDATTEAQYFINVASAYLVEGYLRPVLDLEVGSSMGKEALSAWIHEWISTVRNQTGVEPLLYVNSNYANNYLDNSVTQYDLWIAHWTYDPTLSPNTGIWANWAFWQYSDSGSVQGIVGDVDLDIFNGSTSDLQSFVIGPPTPPEVTTNTATSITANSATLNGSVVSLGTAPSVDVSFEWATDEYFIANGKYNNETTPAWPMGSTGPFNFDLAGLDPGTPYHFRAKVLGDGTSYGEDAIFITSAPTDVMQYAPTLKFDDNEQYFPTNVHGDDNNVINNHENYNVNSPRTCYYHIRPYIQEGFTVYEYWYYYAYNPPWNFGLWEHEHDFEVAFVWVDDNTQKPFSYALSWHFLPPWTYSVSDESELVAYVGLGEHAMVGDGVNELNLIKGDNYIIEVQNTQFQFINIEAALTDHSLDLNTEDKYRSNEPSVNNPNEVVLAPWFRDVFNYPNENIPRLLNTHIGTEVGVPLTDTVVFYENITGAGTTNRTTSQDNPMGPTPSDTTVFSEFVDISTTALYTGPITIGIRYLAEWLIQDESNLRVFHWEGNPGWVDVTSSVDTSNNIVYGQVDSLSWFFVGEPTSTGLDHPGTGSLSPGGCARKLVRTSDGVFHAVYHRSDGLYTQIYHSYSSDNGTTWTEEAMTNESYDQLRPAIATDSSDNLHVVWEGRHAGSPSSAQVRYRKNTAGGWQAIENLTNESYETESNPAIAVDGNDNIHVVWAGFSVPDTAYHHIRYRQHTTSWQPIEEIQEGIGYNEGNPSIAVDGSNNLHLVWMSDGYHKQDPWHLVYRRYTGSWEPCESLNPTSEVGSRACIAAESNGDVHIVGHRDQLAGVAHIEKTSEGWQTPYYLESADAVWSTVSLDNHDNVHVVWESNGNIKHKAYTTAWQPTETLISDTDSTYPNLMYAVWPQVGGNQPNVLTDGYAFIWNDGSEVRFYMSTSEGVPLADTPWPMFQHDLKHTGRSPYSGPESPELKWSFTTTDWIIASPAIGADGTIYVSDNSQAFYAVNPDGSLQWSYPTGGHGSGPAIGADGTIYVGSYDLNLYALNPDGSLKWSYPIGAEVGSSPAIANDGTIYLGSHDYYLYAINTDGSLKWRFLTADVVYSSPAIADDGTIYVGSHDGNVYAVNPDGSFKWSYPTAGHVHSSPALGADGTVYVGSDDGKFYALDPSSGSQIWSYQTVGYIRSSPAIANDGTIYVGSGIEESPGYDNKLYAFNPDGSLQWSYPAGHIIRGCPAVDALGTIYVGSYDDKLHVVNPDGSPKWSYLTGGNVYSNPVIGADGTVYIGSWDRKLYAIGSGAAPSDTMPPATVTNLIVSELATDSVTLSWSAPGDDGSTGTASQYDIRMSTSPINDSNWDSATPLDPAPAPNTAGSSEAVQVTQLSECITYYFALKTADEVPNWSGISNVVTATPPNTLVGSDVAYNVDNDVVTFGTVSGAGCTELTTSQGNPYGELPEGFRVHGTFVDITTTATYTGPIAVCIEYDPNTPNSENLKLFHWESGHWVDVTTNVDTVNHQVCGQVDSLSWFFIGGQWVWVEEGVPVFPSLYIGLAAAFGAAVIAYGIRRRLVHQ